MAYLKIYQNSRDRFKFWRTIKNQDSLERIMTWQINWSENAIIFRNVLHRHCVIKMNSTIFCFERNYSTVSWWVKERWTECISTICRETTIWVLSPHEGNSMQVWDCPFKLTPDRNNPILPLLGQNLFNGIFFIIERPRPHTKHYRHSSHMRYYSKGFFYKHSLKVEIISCSVSIAKMLYDCA